MERALGLLSGLVFGLGLILAGMTDPMKVKGFLDLGGAWDPSLALVMGGAIALGLFIFARAKRRQQGRQLSWSGTAMDLPTRHDINPRLVLGGVLFGIGWGLGGFCPGPAVVALGSGMRAGAVFVADMLVGMALHDRFLRGWLLQPGSEP